MNESARHRLPGVQERAITHIARTTTTNEHLSDSNLSYPEREGLLGTHRDPLDLHVAVQRHIDLVVDHSNGALSLICLDVLLDREADLLHAGLGLRRPVALNPWAHPALCVDPASTRNNCCNAATMQNVTNYLHGEVMR